MSKHAKILLAIIGGLIVLGVLIYFTIRYDKPAEQVTPPPAVVHEAINAKHQYKDGRHIIAGEANVPTPCHILSTDAVVAESAPEQVTITFRTITGEDACAQVLTPARFKVEFRASEDAKIRALWNGDPVDLNLIPAGPEEDLDEFELYIKG